MLYIYSLVNMPQKVNFYILERNGYELMKFLALQFTSCHHIRSHVALPLITNQALLNSVVCLGAGHIVHTSWDSSAVGKHWALY